MAQYSVSHAPHLHKNVSTAKIMWAVFAALIPSGIAGAYMFGPRSAVVIFVSVVSAVACEWFLQKITRQKTTISDGSAALTGLLLAYNLPSGVPFWIPVAGCLFAIVIVKHAFGGLGKNIFNPALAARAFLLVSWPKFMTVFIAPFSPDAVTAATPLMLLKEGNATSFTQLGLSYWDLFIGRRGGCIGEVCIAALLLGALFLLWKGYISWHIPFSFVATTMVCSWAFGADGFGRGDMLFAALSGGVVLGAFFMATDYVTSPLGRKAQVIFGIGCGLLTVVIRRWGGYPEGVSFAILMMNACTALLDRYVRPRVYGTGLTLR